MQRDEEAYYVHEYFNLGDLRMLYILSIPVPTCILCLCTCMYSLREVFCLKSEECSVHTKLLYMYM